MQPTIRLALAAFAWLATSAANAFLTFDGNPKWGSSAPGSGAVVSWSVMPEGTGVVRSPDSPPYLFEDFWQGSNNLGAVWSQLDANPATGQAIFMSALQAAFATWGAAANIQFVQVADDGSPIGFTGSTAGKVGDIRIGAYGFLPPFDAVAGHTFEPPGGASSLAAYWASTDQRSDFGDVNLNAYAYFSSWPGYVEGQAYAGFPNDIQGLLTHEVGHALGLGHPEDDGLSPGETDSIMYVGPGCCTTIRRTLGADDVAGIQFLYGAAAPVPEPRGAVLFIAGLLGIAVSLRRRTVSAVAR